MATLSPESPTFSASKTPSSSHQTARAGAISAALCRAAWLVSALLGWLALTGASAAHGGLGPVIDIVAGTPEPGATITIQGDDFFWRSQIELYAGGDTGQTLLGQTFADADGHFTLELKLPSFVRTQPPLLLARADSGETVTLELRPFLFDEAPATVPPGTHPVPVPDGSYMPGQGGFSVDPSVLVLVLFVALPAVAVGRVLIARMRRLAPVVIVPRAGQKRRKRRR